MYVNHLGILLKSEDYDSVGLRRDPKVCISEKFSGDAHTAGLGTTCWVARLCCTKDTACDWRNSVHLQSAWVVLLFLRSYYHLDENLCSTNVIMLGKYKDLLCIQGVCMYCFMIQGRRFLPLSLFSERYVQFVFPCLPPQKT